jgi:para-aminobenzoate synthetase/4-amino-4-deoxychorismate lyase
VPDGWFELLETMAYVPGPGLRHEAAHLARLRASAEYFGFPLDVSDVRSRLHHALAGVRRPTRVRLAAGRTGEVTVELRPLPGVSRRPVRLGIAQETVPSTSVWLQHKTTRREAYDERRARHPDADDVVLVNEHGQLTESTIANLAIRLDGAWYTPPLAAGCLPGVERAHLVREGRLRERVLLVEHLRSNEGLAVVSSLRGWRPAALR